MPVHHTSVSSFTITSYFTPQVTDCSTTSVKCEGQHNKSSTMSRVFLPISWMCTMSTVEPIVAGKVCHTRWGSSQKNRKCEKRTSNNILNSKENILRNNIIFGNWRPSKTILKYLEKIIHTITGVAAHQSRLKHLRSDRQISCSFSNIAYVIVI